MDALVDHLFIRMMLVVCAVAAMVALANVVHPGLIG
jgi:hypothetical protein